jgi:hypothetical protein
LHDGDDLLYWFIEGGDVLFTTGSISLQVGFEVITVVDSTSDQPVVLVAHGYLQIDAGDVDSLPLSCIRFSGE